MDSPRSRLRAKLSKKKQERAPARREPRTEPSLDTTSDRLSMFPAWLARQLVRSWPEVSHNSHPFMLLFRFDMTDDPLTEDASAMVGSRLDVLLVKINGGIYYESSTHMDGLQKRIGTELKVTPGQLLYVHSPATHVKGAEVEISSDLSRLCYVATVPAAWAREGREWEVPLDPDVHLPKISSLK